MTLSKRPDRDPRPSLDVAQELVLRLIQQQMIQAKADGHTEGTVTLWYDQRDNLYAEYDDGQGLTITVDALYGGPPDHQTMAIGDWFEFDETAPDDEEGWYIPDHLGMAVFSAFLRVYSLYKEWEKRPR